MKNMRSTKGSSGRWLPVASWRHWRHRLRRWTSPRADGAWTFSVSGEINVDYIFSSCESQSSAVPVTGGLACVGTGGGSDVLQHRQRPAAGVDRLRREDDPERHRHLQRTSASSGYRHQRRRQPESAGKSACRPTSRSAPPDWMSARSTDLRHERDGHGSDGRQIGLFGADAILNDMTLIGVGGPGSAAGPGAQQYELGGIGLGQTHTDWLSADRLHHTGFLRLQFHGSGGLYPLNSLTEPALATTQPKKAPWLPCEGRPSPCRSTIRPSCTSRWRASRRSSTTGSPSGRMRRNDNDTGSGGDISCQTGTFRPGGDRLLLQR